MKTLLPASLLALTIAFSGAAMAHSDWYGKEGQDEKPSYMESALSKLPAEKATKFRDAMKESSESNKKLEERMYRLHDDLHAILTAPVFNRDAFFAKRAELQKLHGEMEKNRTEDFAYAVSDLSQKERVTLTRALDHQKHHHRHVAQVEKNTEYSGEPNASIKH